MDYYKIGGPDNCSGGNLRLFLVICRFSTDPPFLGFLMEKGSNVTASPKTSACLAQIIHLLGLKRLLA